MDCQGFWNYFSVCWHGLHGSSSHLDMLDYEYAIIKEKCMILKKNYGKRGVIEEIYFIYWFMVLFISLFPSHAIVSIENFSNVIKGDHHLA